jgi:hypothetical protein
MTEQRYAVLGGELRLTTETHERFRLIGRSDQDRYRLSSRSMVDLKFRGFVNHVREVGRVATTDATDRHDDLIMVRVVGNAAKRQPCGFLLIAEVPPNNFNTRLVAVMGLIKIVQNEDRVRWYRLSRLVLGGFLLTTAYF